MSLRTKIALGLLVVPGITAILLMILIVFGLQRAAESTRQQMAENRTELQSFAEDTGRQRDDLMLRSARSSVVGALWDAPDQFARGDFTSLQLRLQWEEFIVSAVVVTVEGEVHPKSLKGFKGTSPENIQELLGANTLDRELRASVLETRQFAGKGNLLYFPIFDPATDKLRWLVRFEALVDPIPVPDLQLEMFDSGGIVVAALWTLGLGALAMMLVLALTVRHAVLKPLESLVSGSQRVANSDFSRPLDVPLGRDEMARLIKAFNLMQEKIRDHQQEMRSQIDEATARIREQERSLAIAQRLAATGTLAAGMAHEVNNPLGGMMNAVSRLKKNTTDERELEYLELIAEGSKRIQGLMRQILDFSRRRDSKPENLDLETTVGKSVDLTRHRFDDRHKLEVVMEENLPPVFGDPSALGQVIVNLLLNARDALGADGGEVRIGLQRRDAKVEIEVSDTGCGMDAQTLSRIFDPFFTTKEPGKGTGLGLSIVHTIIENHGGEITVSSEPGKGSTFSVILPISKMPPVADGS